LPSIIAGNSVILKHSSQTPLCGERFGQAWTEAGLPDGVFQVHATHAFFVLCVPLYYLLFLFGKKISNRVRVRGEKKSQQTTIGTTTQEGRATCCIVFLLLLCDHESKREKEGPFMQTHDRLRCKQNKEKHFGRSTK
jgi:hypothetical protein